MRIILRTSLSVVSAAALLLGGATPMQAAGALAIGACAAYGYAYDYPTAEAAQAAAIEKCSGDCKQVVPPRRAASRMPLMDGSLADRTALPTRRGLARHRTPR